MAGTPTWLAEGNTPYRDDPQGIVEAKILGATIDGAAGSVTSYAAGGNYSGAVPPEGVQVANPGATYVLTVPPGTLYFKISGIGTNTGWV